MDMNDLPGSFSFPETTTASREPAWRCRGRWLLTIIVVIPVLVFAFAVTANLWSVPPGLD